MRTIKISPAHASQARVKFISVIQRAKLVQVPVPLEKSMGESANAINDLCRALEDIKQSLITLIQAGDTYTKQVSDAFLLLDRSMQG